jgi:hypothetical protein
VTFQIEKQRAKRQNKRYEKAYQLIININQKAKILGRKNVMLSA